MISQMMQEIKVYLSIDILKILIERNNKERIFRLKIITFFLIDY